jgi:CheY-like chemotaxis protein
MSKGPVLIVDDDRDIRELLAETLENHGFSVLVAAHGGEALEIVRRMDVPPKMILLDLMMPVMDGYAFLDARRDDPRLLRVPVAVVTAGDRIDLARLSAEAEIVPKPIDVPRLLELLDGCGGESG